MKFTLQINMDNAAFTDEPASEVARLLRNIARKVEAGDTGRTILDFNGNTAGRWDIKE